MGNKVTECRIVNHFKQQEKQTKIDILLVLSLATLFPRKSKRTMTNTMQTTVSKRK